MSPLIVGLSTGVVVVLLIAFFVIRSLRRSRYLFQASNDILFKANQARYIYEVDIALLEMGLLFNERGDLYRNRIRMLGLRREQMVEDRILYAPYEVIQKACQLLQVPDDACDADICRAAKCALKELNLKTHSKRNPPRGVRIRAKELRQEIFHARDILRKRPK